MTLTKKMALGVLGLLLVIFIGTFLITFNNERNFFIQQMNSNAQDTATSLGLSLSHGLYTRDKASVLSMVEAVFDRGYFAMIEVRNIRGELLVARYAPKRKHSAPDWFHELIQWPSTVQSATVMHGWNQVGEVLVSSDTGYAVDALWLNTMDLSIWYGVFVALSLLIVYWFIRWLLRPLKRLTRQAEAIGEKEFPIETTIPRTRELKKVTLAMNQMVTRIKKIFNDQLQQMETLRHQSFQDSLTGLGNRRYFLQQLSALLNHDEEFAPGFVILVVIDGLDKLNHDAGYQQGDNVVKQVAKACRGFWKETASTLIARIGGSSFAILVKENDAAHFVSQCDSFNQSLQKLLTPEFGCRLVMSATSYQLHQTPRTLLSEVDSVLMTAREAVDGLAYSDNLPAHNPANIARGDLLQAISNRQLVLFGQAVTNGERMLHQEIFVRMALGEDLISAGYFMPLAIRNGLASQIDRFVLEEVINKGLLNTNDIALNITETTVVDEELRKQYLKQLAQIPSHLLEKLNIELNELIVLNHFSQVMVLVKNLQKLGVQIGVDQVGIHFSPMHYLKQLPLNYLKLHGSLIQDIQENQNKQFFIHYFNEMANTLDIRVIATQIESDKQWLTLKSLNLHWGQGQYLGSVHPMTGKKAEHG
ncbi:GGDEF domain-containing protein [Legionella taurinensis]|uniref:GGDEF domain-containing protein n=2 Tax=Legionella taurinensis TaxID=70611 RepID=A0AB38N854_9GAMM|nr:EAL domain-containing protein [Legionella taurinensis]MDX1836694.1 EAL domain-containing protein [Legionella taurinensis]PUT42851.1 GGDEF domain-containing protein [Legionella taurinensis]PUT45406.1 GGDEF domain-containing protein [Legionella taurinensis]PUT47019.1 GGDEF domain-containing protein [Legionella taurinensis]PUT49173.1 GGDEF domain-containing protein [Legionella taurinensis]